MENTPMKKQLIETVNATPLGLAGSRGVRAECYRIGNLVCMSGQTAITLDGKFVGGGDPAAQARQACENIKRLMEKAGGRMSDVVKLTVYVTDLSYREAAYPVIRSFFEGNMRPCQTGVVAGLAREDLLIEIDAWGFIDDSD
jgi:enamine deaminase RidA (YjgF/YER057c/UK114 family)